MVNGKYKSQIINRLNSKRIKAVLCFSLIFLLSCATETGSKREGFLQNEETIDEFTGEINIDLEEIKKRGKLVAITGYSSTSYFIYRGRPMGYEYELLSRFARHLGVELEIVLSREIDGLINMLNNGEGDIIAYSLTVTKDRMEKVDFTEHHNEVRQVLIQRKPANWRKLPLHQIEGQLIRNPIDLSGKTVYVRKNSSYSSRLKNLDEEIGGGIVIREAPGDMETEELIKKVANGEIDYTVADENVALINKTYFSNIDIKTPVSFPQKIAWAVRKSSPGLKQAVDNWINSMKKETDYYVIYNKYYKNRKEYVKRVNSEYYSLRGSKISQYDDILKAHGEKIEWDWRLLAAQVYQESRFNPEAESWAGAMGLMQLMPATAERFGVENMMDPKQSVEAGTKFLKWLDNYWKKDILDKNERIKFVLASYNVGPGHVEDARKLAGKYGKDPTIWDGNVAEFLREKSKAKYYNDEVVKFGYCRGDEPFEYVRQIMNRYHQYTQFIPGQELEMEHEQISAVF